MSKSTDPRRLIKFGNASYVVSLPSAWVKENRLNKGDLVYLERSGNELVVIPKESEYKEKRITINVDGKDIKNVEEEIHLSYVAGYNLITIKGKDFSKKSKEIRKIFDGLMGINTIEQTPQKIVVKDFLDVSDLSVNEVISRIDNLLRDFFGEVIEVLGVGRLSVERHKEFYNIDRSINKFYFLMWKLTRTGMSDRRILENLKTNSLSLLDVWWMAVHFEHMGDGLKRISDVLLKAKLKGKDAKEIRGVLREIRDSYVKVMRAYYNNNKELAYEIQRKKAELVKKCHALKRDANMGKIAAELDHLCGLTYALSRIIVVL